MPEGVVVSAQGSILYVGADPATGTAVPDITKFPGFRSAPDPKDTTTMTDTMETSRPGLPKPGDLKFTGLFSGMTVNGNNGKNWAALWALQEAGVPADFSVKFANGDGWTWSAYVYLEMDESSPDDNKTFTITMYPQGAVLPLNEAIPPVLTFACVDGTAAGATKIATVSPALTGGNSYLYKVNGAIPLVGDDLTGLGWASYTLGADIPCVDDNYIALAEVSTGDVVVKAGRSLSVVE